MIEVNRRLYLKNGGAVPKSLERLQGLTEAVVRKVLEAWKREVRNSDVAT
jgi:hypothetical protein